MNFGSRTEMMQVHYDGGVELPEIGLWLDPRRPKPLAFVSHAHSDHTGKHDATLLTPTTAKLMQAREGASGGLLHLMEFGERRDFGQFQATLIPAGHVFGSAQILIECASGSLLYTGDFKLRRGRSAEPAESRQADTLIMETTYGLPKYCLPPTEEVVEAMVRFCREALEDGATPVLLGYSLGKAQEILSSLEGAGLEVMVHGTIWKVTQIYKSLGIPFPAHAEYDAEKLAGKVLLCPPSVHRSRLLARIRNRRVAMISGWALDPGAVYRYGCDAAFPMSDHADYPDLLRQVELVAPRRVLTLHGFASEFARDLRARGMEAWSLTGPNQLELAVPVMTDLPAAANPAPADRTLRLEQSGFGRFCLTCELMAKSTGKLAKVRLLAEFLRRQSDPDLGRASVWLTGRIFSVGEDAPTGVGWSLIRRALMDAAKLPEARIRAVSRRHNDLGLTALEVLGPVATASRRLEMGDLQAFFFKLRDARGPGLKVELLRDFLLTLTALEGAYVVKILTGDLRLGLKEGLVEEALALAFQADPAQVREANMLMGDIGRTAAMTRHNRLWKADVSLFRPVKCMLASPEPNEEAAWERLGGSGRVWVEDKLDGIRLQVHSDGRRAELYSRDLKCVTASFPEIARAVVGLGRPLLADAELIAFAGGRPLDFFELQKRLGRRDPDLFMDTEIPVACVLFDLLWLDGLSLMRKPLQERRRELERLILPPSLQISQVRFAASSEELASLFGEARERGHEGLMLKDPLSVYSPGRRGLAWIKLKKALATLDVVVVAVEYGHGRRSKVLSDYTFALRDESGGLFTIGKAYSGLTDAEIAGLTPRFKELAIRQRGNRIEVRPEIVLEVAFDSVRESPRHASGLALRFPRIKRLRTDKQPGDIDTVASARRLLQRPSGD